MRGRGALRGLSLDEIWAAFSSSVFECGDENEATPGRAGRAAPRSVVQFVRACGARLRQAESQGDPTAAAALALASNAEAIAASSDLGHEELPVDACEDELEIEGVSSPERDLLNSVRSLAADAFAAGRTERAALLLSSLLFLDQPGVDPVLGLAVCAVKLDRLEEAFALATESLRRGSKHPRAFCIVGLCEFDRGERAAARTHLAIAARLARSRPEFREDMRMAQRLLLILNFGWEKPARSRRAHRTEE